MSGNRNTVEPSELEVVVEEKPEIKAEATQEKENSENGAAPEEAKAQETETEQEAQATEQATLDPEEEKRREIDSRVSKGVAKRDEDIKQMATLLMAQPDKVKELKEQNPDLYSRLEKQLPEINTALTPAEKKEESELATMVKELLDAKEDAQIELWAEANSISEADLTARQSALKAKAKTLLSNNLVSDFGEALNIAGGLVFPSTKGKGVDDTKLEKLASAGATTSSRTPDKNGELDPVSKAAMSVTGASKEEVESYTVDEIPVPLD